MLQENGNTTVVEEAKKCSLWALAQWKCAVKEWMGSVLINF